MPKLSRVIKEFHGGLNSHAEKRDVAKNELTQANDLQVDKLGKVTCMSSNTAATNGITDQAITAIEAGYGLMHFQHDYEGMGSAYTSGIGAASPNATPTSYTILASPATDQRIYIYAHPSGGWSSSFDLGTGNNFKMIGFVVDGALRVHDANFDNVYTPKWFGFLKRDYFSVSEEFEGWYSESAIYTPPSVTGSTDTAPTQVAGKFNHTTTSAGSPLGAISIKFTEGSGGFATGNWDFASDNYLFYVSYIYDGGYDSPLVYLVDSNKLTTVTGDNKQLVIHVGCKTAASDTWFTKHSPRIIGFRLYFKKDVSYWTQPSEAWCIQETYFSLSKGSRTPLSGTWREWVFSTGGNENTYLTFTAPPEIISYEDINGFMHDDITSAQFKASCVANRKTYIGNIKQDGVVYGDMMIKSPVNGFDLFPKSRSIEATISDGDEIIQLEEYADRILQFKRNKMHLINVSQEIEFLEDTFVHKGVSNPNATCKTDFGVAWVNKHGCYLYDGKQVTNLLEKKNVKIIDEDDWLAHVGDKSIIEYLPKKRQLMVIKDYSSTSSGKNIYLFDMVTQSWVTSDDAVISTNVDMTNTVIDKNGDLMWAYRNGSNDATFLKWSTTPVAQSNFALRTKAFAFGNPSQRKKIYKVYITHKNAGSSQLGLYGEFHSQKAIAGQGVGELSNDFFFGYLTPDTNANNFVQQEFSVPSTNLNNQSIDFNSVYTLRLYILSNKVWTPNSNPGGNLVGTAPAGFEINDITVVYRLKSVK